MNLHNLKIDADFNSGEQIYYIGANQDGTCFSVGTSWGMRCFEFETWSELGKKEIPGGTSIVEMLGRSNLVALVGTGEDPNYPKKAVVVWDDDKNVVHSQFPFTNPVLSVHFADSTLIVATCASIFVCPLDGQPRTRFDTVYNERGTMSVATGTSELLMAFPTTTPGSVEFLLARDPKKRSKEGDRLAAHTSDVAVVCISSDGKLLATASFKGTVIRVYSLAGEGIPKASMIKEVRRGTQQAIIHSMAFSEGGKYLASSGRSGTIHVFDLKGKSEQPNKRSTFSFLAPVNSYFESEWSFAWAKGPPTPSYLTFDRNEETVLRAVTADGQGFSLTIDPIKGGEMEALVVTWALSSTEWGEPSRQDKEPEEGSCPGAGEPEEGGGDGAD